MVKDKAQNVPSIPRTALESQSLAQRLVGPVWIIGIFGLLQGYLIYKVLSRRYFNTKHL